MTGSEIWVKHENFQILGAFKVRGGLNLIPQLPAEQLQRGVITASSGNHGQSIAFAARAFGAASMIVVPEGANPGKVRSMQHLGAEVVFKGSHYDASRGAAVDIAEKKGYRYIDAANEPDLISGVATYSLEIFEDVPDIDVVIVPVGAGSGACGASIVRSAVSPGTQVIGVQAAAAPAAQLSWSAGELVDAPMNTDAEGLATAHAYEFPQSILREELNDFILIEEDEIDASVALFLEHTHTLVEGASATSLAAALALKDLLQGKRVVIVATGANLSMAQLDRVISARRN